MTDQELDLRCYLGTEDNIGANRMMLIQSNVGEEPSIIFLTKELGVKLQNELIKWLG